MTKKKSMTPPLSMEAHENKLISLALKQAESELAAGTASSQVLSHFLKLATIREEAEREKLKLENMLLEEKIASERSHQSLEAMYEDVIRALKSYTLSDER